MTEFIRKYAESMSHENLIEEYLGLFQRHEDRAAAMQDTGDIVRSLYQGSEVSKRMTQLTLKLERAKAVLEQIDAEWCPHPGLRLDHNPHLNRDWCGSCTNWIRRGETNPAREALKELE